MATVPFVLYGILRYLYLIHQKGLGGSPELVLVRDEGMVLAYTWRVGDEGLWAESLSSFFALDAPPFRESRRRAFVRLATPVEGHGSAARGRAQRTLDTFLSQMSASLPGIQER